MLSKESEHRYHAVIHYDTDKVFVQAMRGTVVDREIEVYPPSFFDRILGASTEKRVHKASKEIQCRCAELNEKLDQMRQACTDATDQPVPV